MDPVASFTASMVAATTSMENILSGILTPTQRRRSIRWRTRRVAGTDGCIRDDWMFPCSFLTLLVAIMTTVTDFANHRQQAVTAAPSAMGRTHTDDHGSFRASEKLRMPSSTRWRGFEVELQQRRVGIETSGTLSSFSIWNSQSTTTNIVLGRSTGSRAERTCKRAMQEPGRRWHSITNSPCCDSAPFQIVDFNASAVKICLTLLVPSPMGLFSYHLPRELCGTLFDRHEIDEPRFITLSLFNSQVE